MKKTWKLNDDFLMEMLTFAAWKALEKPTSVKRRVGSNPTISA